MKKKYSEPPYYSGRLVKFKLHIDHIDNEDKRIWAVDVSRGPYLTSKEVSIRGQFYIKGTRIRKDQPRAYLEGYGYVVQKNINIIIIEGIEL